ncbi:MAG: hypothetical protein KDD66_07575 [Bdellovibrionales bacterium]|nr:hypothetical protein [Bdellovibrionales bacterium]
MAQDEKSADEVLRAMLKPILRYCLKRALNIQHITEKIKEILLEIAVEEIEETGEKVNVSRLSVMTGIHRRDVSRLHKEKRSKTPESTHIENIINRWEQDPAFITKAGKPKLLSFQTDDSEFHTLVRKVLREVGPAAILFEMERQGLVEKTNRGLKLVRHVHRLEEPSKILNLFAENAATLAKAAEQNAFEPGDPRNLHLRTEYKNIYQSDVPAIREWIYQQGHLFHRKVRHYLSLHDKDISPDPKKVSAGSTVVVGAFSWTEGEKTGQNVQ